MSGDTFKYQGMMEEMPKGTCLYQIRSCGLMAWQDCQGFGRNKVRKLVARRSRKEVCRQLFLNRHRM